MGIRGTEGRGGQGGRGADEAMAQWHKKIRGGGSQKVEGVAQKGDGKRRETGGRRWNKEGEGTGGKGKRKGDGTKEDRGKTGSREWHNNGLSWNISVHGKMLVHSVY